MKKSYVFVSFLTVLIFSTATLMGCKTRKTTSLTPLVTYTDHVRPLMLRSCTPCHFPENGRKKMLDTYEAAAENIKDILHRVSLPKDHKDFMPFKNKREPLTPDEIDLIQLWVKNGMPK